jgi:hypothetical protein
MKKLSQSAVLPHNNSTKANWEKNITIGNIAA